MDQSFGYKFAAIRIRALPQFTQFSLELSTLLDQDHPTGKDFRMFLECLGFYQSEIGFLASRVQRPTVEALRSWEGSIGELVEALRVCERQDAINLVSRWIAIAANAANGLGDSVGQYGHRHGSPNSYLPGSRGRYRLPLTSDVPPIEELLEATYYPSDVVRQISASSVITEDDTSRIRRSSEYLCDQFTASLKGCFLIPKDATWMTNSTVYVNNFARAYFVVILFANLISCLFSAEHCPVYAVEFFIALIPVWESIYVDRHLQPYKELIKATVKSRQKVDSLERKLASCVELERGPCHGRRSRHPSEWGCECMPIYKELQVAKSDEEKHMNRAQPKYTDLRLCVFSSLMAEAVIIFAIMIHALLCETFVVFHERLRDGFTSCAYILLLVDCFYNTVVIVCFYSHSTPRVVVEKDRFRHRHELADAVQSHES